MPGTSPGMTGLWCFDSLRDEGARRISRAEIVEIDVPALVVSDEPLGLVSETEQPLAEPDRNHVVARSMHDQQGRPDGADALVRMELVMHQPAHGHERKQAGRDV